ncbi:SIMPL domain-containing protein [Chlorobaculum sp. 24CR]|uniref:SIMPL domain-containing protein n=1 Tax=Chlorobaculum sp. 24CR TaxID=2508878 RepID=UPI001FD6DBBB|nr:SIMPL domain-containing protein [Chlorobaculum sp. 24CR]
MKGHSGFRKVTIMVLALLCCSLPATSLHAVESGISVSASSAVTYDPDTAEFTTTVESTGKDAARAAAATAALWSELQQALRKAGVSAADASSASYTVSPEWEWNRSTGKREFRGYKARHVVRVVVRDLGKLGGAIDAVVGAGAGTGTVDGLRYFSSRFESLRLQALADAVRSARRDAEVIARAAGGKLGALQELQYGQPQNDFPVMRAVMAEAAPAGAPPTDVQPGEQKLTVSVSSRWQYLSGSGK